MKKRVVLDSSVIIAGSLTSGPAGKILDQFRKNKFSLVVSLQILREVKDAFAKKKILKYYHFSEEEVEHLIAEILERSEVVVPKEEIFVCRDPFDNHVLSLTKAAKAHFLVSYDKDLLVLEKFATAKIVSPKDFLVLVK